MHGLRRAREMNKIVRIFVVYSSVVLMVRTNGTFLLKSFREIFHAMRSAPSQALRSGPVRDSSPRPVNQELLATLRCYALDIVGFVALPKLVNECNMF
jgi:hypothetical protein